MFNFTFTDEQRAELINWSAELRTTNKPQVIETLRAPITEDIQGSCGYCCLGIYLDMKRPEGWIFDPDNYWVYIKSDEDTQYDTALPEEDSEKLGLLQSVTVRNKHNGNDYRRSLSLEELLVSLNDDSMYTFPQIADEIMSLIQTGNFTDQGLEDLEWEPIYAKV